MPDDRTERQFRGVLEECKSVFLAKLRDYGPAWRFLRLPALADKILIKAKRIRRLGELGGQGQIPDSAEAEYIGIANYCLVALIVIDAIRRAGPSDVEDLLADRWSDPDAAMAELDRLIASTTALLARKNHDYDDAWRDMDLSSYPDEILSRMARVKHMAMREAPGQVSEALESQFYDTLNYAALALVRHRHEAHQGSGA